VKNNQGFLHIAERNLYNFQSKIIKRKETKKLELIGK